MAKFCGVVGYHYYDESEPFRSIEKIAEREYFGDVLQFKRRWENTEYQNDTFNVDNKISIVADPFAYEHFHSIRYVQWMGVKWRVTNIEVQYPRLILTIGGVYNEDSD